jgi:ribosomal protein S18 acetylase RimI-like enzyme
VDVREFRAGDGAVVRAALDERGLAATALGGWDGRRGWLYHVAVRPDRRRHGLGGRLVRIIEDRLRDRGCPKVNLIVWDDNAAAMNFWAASGYRRAATVEFEKEL